MTEMKARLVDKDGNPLGTAANPLKISGDVGGGVPDGGTTGQVLQKKTDADQDTEWGDVSVATTSWGSITGTLADQTDLNMALGGKVPTTRTVNSKALSSDISLTPADVGSASSTTASLSILIYDGTPSAGDLTTYDEIYTTPALCFAALPAIINHAVTITMRKADGSAYAAATLQRVVAGGSITIQGEYFFKNTVASGGTGVFTLNESDVGVLAGDRVYLQRYTGVVESSSPDLALFDTVASVDGTTITLTTHTSQEITTSWVYVIVRTVTDVLSASYTNNVTFTGLNIASSTYCLISSCNEVFFTSCIFDSSGTIALQYLNSSNNSYNSNLGFSCTYTGSISTYHYFVNTSRAYIRWSAIISSALSKMGGTAMIAAAYMSIVDVSRCYLKNSAGGTIEAVCARSAYVSVSITYVDGYDASSKMTVALYGIMGGVIYCASPVFGSNITTQKSPANWAATTDGSFVS